MADSSLTPEQIFALGQYAEALNTLAQAIGQLVADEVITPVEARAALFRVGVLTEQDSKEIEARASFAAEEAYMDAIHVHIAEGYRRQRESGCTACIERAKSLRGPCEIHSR